MISLQSNEKSRQDFSDCLYHCIRQKCVASTLGTMIYEDVEKKNDQKDIIQTYNLYRFREMHEIFIYLHLKTWKTLRIQFFICFQNKWFCCSIRGIRTVFLVLFQIFLYSYLALAYGLLLLHKSYIKISAAQATTGQKK